MVGLGLLAALVVLGIPVAVIALIVSMSRLRHRVAMLEAEVRALGIARPPASVAALPEAAPPVADSPGPAAEDTAPPEAVLATAPGAAAPSDPADAGPWQAGPAPDPGPAVTPRGPSAAERLSDWLKVNWVYAVSALSLALAGVFFVQYGIENGLLTPPMRVAMAILVGIALIVAGEVVRRRSGDEGRTATAQIPSTFSGAGIVAIFAGILAARQLYGLIGPGTALAGLVGAAAASVVIGWFYGPFLAAVGLVGATAAPFVVGGDSASPEWLYPYFLLVAAFGLSVDTLRRWAWVSALAVVLGYLGLWLLSLSGADPSWFAAALVILPVLAIAIPARSARPDQSGAMIVETMLPSASAPDGARPVPQFPTILAAGAVAASVIGLTLLPGPAGAGLAAFAGLAGLAVLLSVWARHAPALADLAVLPAAGFLARLAVEAARGDALWSSFVSAAIEYRAPETQPPATVSVLVALAAAVSAAAVWRALREDRLRPFWAAGAAVTAPVAALLLELFWLPSATLGAYRWALHVVALSALMTAAAVLFARSDEADRRGPSYTALAAMSLIALALFLILSEAALTVALAVLVAVAAALDRRFRLPEMGLFVQAAVIVLGWRLTVDPGIDWAMRSSWSEVILAFGAALAGMGGALKLLEGLERRGAKVFLEGGIAAYAAILANVVITRMIEARIGGTFVGSYWSASLNALPWLVVSLVQLHRMQVGGRLMNIVRGVIAAVAGLFAAAGLGAAATVLSPLEAWGPEEADRLVYGPPVLDTLLLAYGLPGILLLVAATRLTGVPVVLRRGLMGVGAAFLALCLALEIRRFWRGDFLAVGGTTQPELYSYTVALLVVGALLLYQAIARRSPGLRRIAMGVIALTVAKVFLIDASGLSGLTRVVSFLGLGLALAGLAWLNRWAAGRGEGGESVEAGPPA